MGNNVRRRKSRRKARIASSKQSQKLKKKQTKKFHFELGILRDRWDHRKTLRQNLDSLGLAYDSNAAVPIQREKYTNQEEIGDLADYTKTTDSEIHVADKVPGDGILTGTGRKKNRRMSCSMAKFIAEMVKSHGTNYKGMARDSRNYNQLTEAQIKKKCEQYLSSVHNTPRVKEPTD